VLAVVYLCPNLIIVAVIEPTRTATHKTLISLCIHYVHFVQWVREMAYFRQEIATVVNDVVETAPGILNKPMVGTGLVKKLLESGRYVDPVEMAELVDKISKIQKRMKDIENSSALTQKELQMLIQVVQAAGEQYVPEKDQEKYMNYLRQGLGNIGS